MLVYQKQNYLYQMLNLLNEGLRNRCHLVVAYGRSQGNKVNSTAITADANGNLLSETRYSASRSLRPQTL